MTAGTWRTARALLSTVWPKHGHPDWQAPGRFDDDAWKRRLRETEQILAALYARLGREDPDTVALIAQMLDDEGQAYSADLVRQLFPPGEVVDAIPDGGRQLASLHTGRLGVVVNLRPRTGR